MDEFSIQLADNPAVSLNQLTQHGRHVAPVEARKIEAQFRLPDGCIAVLASDDEPFKEKLLILLVGPDLRVRDQVILGGAYTPGFLAYAAPHSAREIVFCWHDHEQVVTIDRRRTWFGLRTRWLTVRDLVPQRDPTLRARPPRK